MKHKPIYTARKPKDMAPIIHRMVYEELQRQKPAIEKVAIGAITATFLITLHDKHGWDKDRLNELVREVTNQFVCVKENFVTIEDFEAWCREYGIEGV